MMSTRPAAGAGSPQRRWFGVHGGPAGAVLAVLLYAGAVAADQPACLPAGDVAEAMVREIAPDIDVIPYRMALLPPDADSGVPARAIDDLVVALEAALRRLVGLADIIERRRLDVLGREVGAERLAQIQNELAVDGLLLVRARPAPGGASVAVDGLELTNGALGQSFVASLDHCLAVERLALPLEVSLSAMAAEALERLDRAGRRLTLGTRLERVGAGGAAADRLFEGFVAAVQGRAGGGAGVARLTVEPVLRPSAGGAVEVSLWLTPEDGARLLVQGLVNDPQLSAPQPAGRVRTIGAALLSAELDQATAEQAAMAQARAAAIATAVPEMAMPAAGPVASIGTARRDQAALGRALTVDERWQVAAGDGRIEAALEARVVVLADAGVLIREASLEDGNLADGAALYVRLDVAEPVHVALIGWFADGKALRLVPPEGGAAVLLPAGRHRLPRQGQFEVQVQRAPGVVAAHEAVVVVASRRPIEGDRLAPAMAPSLAESMARARPIGELFDALAALGEDGVDVAVLSYTILPEG